MAAESDDFSHRTHLIENALNRNIRDLGHEIQKCSFICLIAFALTLLVVLVVVKHWINSTHFTGYCFVLFACFVSVILLFSKGDPWLLVALNVFELVVMVAFFCFAISRCVPTRTRRSSDENQPLVQR